MKTYRLFSVVLLVLGILFTFFGVEQVVTTSGKHVVAWPNVTEIAALFVIGLAYFVAGAIFTALSHMERKSQQGQTKATARNKW